MSYQYIPKLFIGWFHRKLLTIRLSIYQIHLNAHFAQIFFAPTGYAYWTHSACLYGNYIHWRRRESILRMNYGYK